MLKIQQHYPDLTEVGQLSSAEIPGDGHWSEWENRPLTKTLEVIEKSCTELAFAHIPAESYESVHTALTKSGWTPISKALNWHSSHKGDHPITLYTKKFEGRPVAEKYHHSAYMVPGHRVRGRNACFKFGCGGRLLNGLEDVLALNRATPKPLTLLRIPKTEILNLNSRSVLNTLGYREVEQTNLATYWTNGKAPAEYKEQEERDFWRGWEARTSFRNLKRMVKKAEF